VRVDGLRPFVQIAAFDSVLLRILPLRFHNEHVAVLHAETITTSFIFKTPSQKYFFPFKAAAIQTSFAKFFPSDLQFPSKPRGGLLNNYAKDVK
jgi:hypothetical protein